MLFYNLTDNGQLAIKLKTSPVVQIRMRVSIKDVNHFLHRYIETFLPVDAMVPRETQIYFYDSRSHYNLLFLYRYRDVSTMNNLHDLYPRKWAEHYGMSAKDAMSDLHKKEQELYAFVEDDERLVLKEYEGNKW